MLLNILFIVVGIALVLWGADRLTDGAVAVAEKMKMPQIVIGLTIVAMGTSMPEFCVSLISALKGTSDLAVGNIVGSNIFNALLIVGVSALVAPMTIMETTVRKDIPFALVASALLLIMCLDGNISRIDAGILFAMFLIFMYMTLKGAKKQGADAEEAIEGEGKKPMSTWLSVVWILVGLLCLIGGSNLFVEGATAVATNLGVSEAVIGLTIVAGGTSLPELATSVVSARKGNSGIAIGNALGSNVFNILAILGITGMITPMTLKGITYIDLSMLVISIMIVWLFSFTKYKIERWEGAVLTAVFVGYIYSLL
ncbi:calcium/sodium antiporter [Prevotella melaninogenica]|uniref:calcium/sodium antiporter n=1 Tax=Prevotella melaninogenica TaxID=28132 RepID=UPI001C5F0CF6|nr:calcium/sodium antiporter [Prevotella melaninogenica]MBW4728749.1 calcium/sodium antiporter [Prevotella melaninogenica]MBW4731541.1 calcium/sodium antiporter [Prevotella melaninogenica]MBW4749600.1 calcium/sodium antiporter [Prevotella melaninogenica]